ncbi:hypothetical protein ACI6Q5_05435 [Xanthomonas codiaei]|uniref:Uncharacterized protein n=1 Tax=Xanthomonas codiaei TaxID=56463 RepID=A0A2S7CGY8_9XANT|nr:hypothetical protein [Xanthomonas codiaei]PPU60791.1 hypothetical protein XcodCFBP4690_17065 [Xanthomonas codiaei]
MFRFANLGRVWVPVDLPGGDGETPELVRVHLLMTLYTDDELAARDREVMTRTAASFLEKAATSTEPAELQGAFDDMQRVRLDDRADVLRRTHDWRGFADEEGEPLPFSQEHLEALLAMAYLFQPIRRALFETSREGVRKN